MTYTTIYKTLYTNRYKHGIVEACWTLSLKCIRSPSGVGINERTPPRIQRLRTSTVHQRSSSGELELVSFSITKSYELCREEM